MNPTVEEVKDGSSDNSSPLNSNAESKVSWSEICSQHEAVLSSHLKMLHGIKIQVVANGDASQLISMMIDKTNKLMTQFKVIKKKIMHKANASATMSHRQRSRSESQSGDTPRRNPSKERKKRSRLEQDTTEAESESGNGGPAYTEASRFQKRKRLDLAIPGGDEEVRNVTPVSMETEDISEEVQRRLRIKEERRKKRDAKPEKRKRESIASNVSTSSPGGAMKPKKKRAKVGIFEEGSSGDTHQTGSGKHGRMRELEPSSENSSTFEAKRQKR